MKILLFDIDGTLIHTGGAGGAALRSAFCDTFQVDDAGKVAFSGRTDRAIVSSFFQRHGVEETDANWKRIRNAYVARLPQCMSQHDGCVLPGVRELLEVLRQRDDIALGLLTGNLRDGARIKLEYYELDHYFLFGGFGDEHHDRDDVAHEALQAARTHVNGSAVRHQVWVIGDTPLDVACGRAIGARVLGVMTGIHSREELVAAEPDLLLENLADTRQALNCLFGDDGPNRSRSG